MKILERLINFLLDCHHYRIIKYLKKTKISMVVDVGAHQGEFIKAVNYIKNIKKIYGFEPQKKMFKFLNQKFKNKTKFNFYNLALDKKKSKKYFYINNLTSTSTLSVFNKKSLYLKFKNFFTQEKYNYSKKIPINTTTLDISLKKINLKNCLLKIDVEGFELNVLKGSKKKLNEIDYILIENQFGNHYKNNNFKNVHKYLEVKKFRILKKFIFPLFHYQDILYIKKY